MVLVERRIGLLFAFFLCLILLAGMRSLQLGTLQGGKLAAAATSQQVSEPIVPAHRGTIVDRHGTELAVSQAADDVSATPYLVTDPAKAATKLAPLLGVDEDVVLKQLTRRDTGFVYLGRHVPGDAADKIRRLEIPGIDFTPGQRRTYPHDFLASQVLGGVNMAGKGYAGVEYSLDSKLSGTDGQRRIVRDGVGERRPGPRHQARAPGQGGRAGAGRQHPGRRRVRPRRHRQDLPAQGRDGDRHQPADRRDPGAGQLAADQRQRPVGGARLRAPEPRGRHHL